MMTKQFAFRMFALALIGALPAGCAGFPFGKTPPDTFTLSGPATVYGPAARRKQLLVPTPTALKTLDSNHIVIRTSPSAIQYLSNAQWSDQLTNIVQATLIKSYEGTNKLEGVGRPGEGLAIDYRVLADIRTFSVSTYGTPTATVDIAVKLLNDRNGVVIAQRDFRAGIPVDGKGNPAFVDALDKAFNGIVSNIVTWTLSKI